MAGTGTNISVVGGTLRIADYTTATSTGTYDFENYVDTSAVRRATVRVDFVVSRYSPELLLFDSIIGMFDSLPALFDDLSGGTAYDDINVVTLISTTNDDPAGTPTWSSYEVFVAGDYTARAFRFRIILTSLAPNVTPSITSLAASVQYN